MATAGIGDNLPDGGTAFAVCDIVATKCAAAAAFSATACADGGVNLGVFGHPDFQACADITAVVAAGAALGLVTGHVDALTNTARRDLVTGPGPNQDNLMAPLVWFQVITDPELAPDYRQCDAPGALEWIACASVQIVSGCRVGEAFGQAYNDAGAVSTPLVGSKSCTGDAPSKSAMPSHMIHLRDLPPNQQASIRSSLESKMHTHLATSIPVSSEGQRVLLASMDKGFADALERADLEVYDGM